MRKERVGVRIGCLLYVFTDNNDIVYVVYWYMINMFSVAFGFGSIVFCYIGVVGFWELILRIGFLFF